MKKIIIALLFFAAVSPAVCQIFPELEEELLLYLGQTEVIKASSPERIAVGKPQVADVVQVTGKSITIVAKGKGATTLVWWDTFGEHSLRIKVYQEDVMRLKERIDRLIAEANIEGVYTKGIQGEDKLLLMGEVKDQAVKDNMLAVLGDLAQKTTDLVTIREEEASVEIEVQILELNRDASRELGFDWSFSSIKATEPSDWDLSLQKAPKAIFKVTSWERSAFNTTLDLLVTEGKARILSRPRLVCRSGKEAELLVGGEVPVMSTEIASSSGGEGTSIEYKEYGIKLNIRPTVVLENKIDLGMDVEVSEVDNANVATLGDADAPTARAFPLTKRNISTELSLREGETLTIGGLIKEKDAEDLKKIPWLGDVPILGPFFRHKSESGGGGSGQRGDVELFITLTPRIVRMSEDAHVEVRTPQGKKFSKKGQVFGYYDTMRIPDELKEYIYKVQQQIVHNIAYPSVLMNTGWEANLIVGITLSSVGELKQARIVRPSGYKIFDDQTLETVRRLRYPSFPSHVRLEEISVEVPIVYRTQK